MQEALHKQTHTHTDTHHGIVVGQPGASNAGSNTPRRNAKNYPRNKFTTKIKQAPSDRFVGRGINCLFASDTYITPHLTRPQMQYSVTQLTDFSNVFLTFKISSKLQIHM